MYFCQSILSAFTSMLPFFLLIPTNISSLCSLLLFSLLFWALWAWISLHVCWLFSIFVTFLSLYVLPIFGCYCLSALHSLSRKIGFHVLLVINICFFFSASRQHTSQISWNITCALRQRMLAAERSSKPAFFFLPSSPHLHPSNVLV